MINKIDSLLLAILLITSCQSDPKKTSPGDSSGASVELDKFIGSWVQSNPINEKEVQGFNLKKDGTAESINMATLKYKNWWYEGDQLNLVVESIGNKISFLDTTTYEVTKVTDKELELKNGQITEQYKKQ